MRLSGGMNPPMPSLMRWTFMYLIYSYLMYLCDTYVPVPHSLLLLAMAALDSPSSKGKQVRAAMEQMVPAVQYMYIHVHICTHMDAHGPRDALVRSPMWRWCGKVLGCISQGSRFASTDMSSQVPNSGQRDSRSATF